VTILEAEEDEAEEGDEEEVEACRMVSSEGPSAKKIRTGAYSTHSETGARGAGGAAGGTAAPLLSSSKNRSRYSAQPAA
jgi:hypothetical protein